MEIPKLLPGSLLVAHPLIRTKLFAKSVVLIIESYKKTYKGLIINKKGPYLVKNVIEDCSYSYAGESYLYTGGLMNTSSVILLHSTEWYSSNTMQVNKELAISSDETMVEKLSIDNSPFNYKMFAGVSQWSEAQLKNELSQTDKHQPLWLILESYDTELLFDMEHDTIWDTAIDFYSQNMYDQYF